MSFWTSRNLHPKIKSRFVVSFGTGFFLPNVKSITKPAVEVSTKEYRLMNHFFNYPGLVKWQPIKITFVDMNGILSPNLKGRSLDGNKPFDTASMLYEMLNNSGYAPPTTETHTLGKIGDKNAANSPITTPEKASTIGNSFGDGLTGKSNYSEDAPTGNNRTITIQQINFGQQFKDSPPFLPNARTIEQWKLINPIITNISWGDLDYGSDDLVEYTIDIKYDWAEYEKDVERPIISNVYQTFGNL
jgi:hypothetical protein